NAKPIGDVRVRQSLRDEHRDLPLGRGERVPAVSVVALALRSAYRALEVAPRQPLVDERTDRIENRVGVAEEVGVLLAWKLDVGCVGDVRCEVPAMLEGRAGIISAMND